MSLHLNALQGQGDEARFLCHGPPTRYLVAAREGFCHEDLAVGRRRDELATAVHQFVITVKSWQVTVTVSSTFADHCPCGMPEFDNTVTGVPRSGYPPI